MKKIIFLPILFVTLFLGNFSLASGGWGLDDVVSGKESLKGAFSVDEVNKQDSGTYLSARIGLIIGAILSFIAVIFMILVIYAGILWMTARGNEQQVEKAKILLFQSIIGLIIILSAYIITNFVGNIFSGSDQITEVEQQ